MNQVQRRLVIEMLAVHRPYQRDVVNDLAEMRHQIRDFHAAFAPTRKLVGRRHHAADLVGELDLRHDVSRRRAAGMLLEQRLVIEQINLARAAVHEEMND